MKKIIKIIEIIGLSIIVIFLVMLATMGLMTFSESSPDFISLTLAMPLIVLIYMIIRWYQIGLDPKDAQTIIAEYEIPDKLLPSEVAAILNFDIGYKDIFADIVRLADKKYLTINEIKLDNDFELVKLKDCDDKNGLDHELISKIFWQGANTVKLSEIISRITIQFGIYKRDVFQNLISQGYFPNNPESVRTHYWVVSIILLLIAFFLPVTSYAKNYLIFSAGLSSAIILYFANFMPKRTLKGVKTFKKIYGFKTYLELAELDQLKSQFQTEDLPETYNYLLPYALVLGVNFKWAVDFEYDFENFIRFNENIKN